MTGYVKIDPAELKGKHLSLYRAVYCGLCRTAERRVSIWLSPFLSYDFAFLASLRLAFHPEEVQIVKRRCAAHPLRRRAAVRTCPSLLAAARAELVLTAAKMEDDHLDRDVFFLRRLVEKPFLARFRRVIRKTAKSDPEFAAFSGKMRSLLAEGRELEKSGADLDAMCGNFAAVLSEAFCFGTQGEERAILSRVGEMTGRWLYTVDAADDREKDRKKGAFNPLLEEGYDPADLRQVLLYYCDEAFLALQLASADPDLAAVCENVILYGMKNGIDRVVGPGKAGVES